METAHAILSSKHLRYAATSVPNLDHGGCPIQRFQDAQVHGFAMLTGCLEGWERTLAMCGRMPPQVGLDRRTPQMRIDVRIAFLPEGSPDLFNRG
jgi:hypothetical protein